MAKNNIAGFVKKLVDRIKQQATDDKRSVEKLAASYGITDKTLVKESTELAIVKSARAMAHESPRSAWQKYYNIVGLYQRQVILSHRTSQSILLQQYSTPAPIGYIAGVFCDLDSLHFKNKYGFEPSAGNGLLTIAARPDRMYVNEIDVVRNNNLRVQGFAEVSQQDATLPFKGYWRRFAAVITNPPFGRLDKPVFFDDYKITTLEQLMALRALETMSDDGKAAIIIGGHTRWDKRGRMQAGINRIFFNYLYSRYHVMDVINISGKKLYTRQGTGVNVRLILIDGRKAIPEGVAPLFDKERDVVMYSFDELYNRVTAASVNSMNKRTETLKRRAVALRQLLQNSHDETLEAPYQPASQACVVLDTQVPDSMAFETQTAIDRIRQEVGGDMDNFVRHRLGYPTKMALCAALSAEQIDAVGVAIYNIEARGQGMIIGDQTGIGKGRVAASVIRYATQQGLKPIFLTEKANLFSDIYRDLSAIGSGHLRPFIVNARESKTDIKDEDGDVVYQALAPHEQQRIFESRSVPGQFDFVVATYSQFNSMDKKPVKPHFLYEIAEDNIMILDEAHNSSGSSNTGTFLQAVVLRTRGVTFLSATFAKRPDNMPIYSMKTAISDCTMSREQLVESITRGGVALQEILSAQLVAEGQMLRRERSFEGVEVNYISLDDKAEEHRAIADNITEILRDIIDYQHRFIDNEVEALDEVAAAAGKQTEMRKGASEAGVDNQPYFSKIFQVINQMLFSLKAEAVAERTIMRLKEGKKPVIAFASTMGAFIETLENAAGLPVGDGDVINADFSEVLQRGLDGIFRYTEKDVTGKSVYKRFELSELAPEATVVYNDLARRIKAISTGITISPIDVITKRLKEAGYTVAEVTGRKLELQFGNAGGLGEPGGKANFKPGDRVTHAATGKTGRVQYMTKKGMFVPGRDNTQSYTYEYNLELDSGDTWTFPEEELVAASGFTTLSPTALVLARRKVNTNDAFRRFNNNEIDVLMINQSGSTGASAHAIPTSKVPADQVKQRVMIVLQAELDINTEVQKRGRINRTGQILKPIYDYVTSAIPAEKRLMMMLQKKLKSLDANTTSNQKQSTKILDVPDFLNKYGDKQVAEYLAENPQINALLDDPLGISPTEEGGGSSGPEDAAHRVSGRVAVLSTQMQQDFYNEISARYNDYVEYLQQIGEYDLEVEAMNLQAETISARVVKMGNGSDSAFGDDSILEAVKANVLKKPFSASELNNLLTEALQGKEPTDITRELAANYEQFNYDKLLKEQEEEAAYYDSLIKDIPTEKKIRKLESNQDEWFVAVQARKKELLEAQQKTMDNLQKKSTNSKTYLLKLLNYFYPGRVVNFQVDSMDSNSGTVPAVFIGYLIDLRKKNPFVPSQIKLRFAIANSNKYIALPASYSKDITSIMGLSTDVMQPDRETLLNEWDEFIQQTNVDRKLRHIITGNLLQAFSDFRGKLVSYTTIDGQVKKGLLMPEYWNPGEHVADNVTVPIIKALPLIRSLVQNAHIKTDNALSFFKQGQRFKIVVNGSRAKGGDIYLDKDLLALVDGNNFQKTSDKMVATVDEKDIVAFVEILQRNHSLSMTVNGSQFRQIEKQAVPTASRKPIALPPPAPTAEEESKVIKMDKRRRLELEARALKIKLQLLAA